MRRHKITPRHLTPQIPKSAPPEQVIVKLTKELIEFRREMAELRTQIRGDQRVQSPLPLAMLSAGLMPIGRGLPPSEPMRLASLPDMRQPVQEPALPVPLDSATLPAAIEDRRFIAQARDYLIRTATPGYTMMRQGPDVAIGRLHPSFALKLAEAIRQARAQGLEHAGVFSAYRPPAFGVGGFGDKFNSLHSYGLAADMTGIGGPGSHAAHLWHAITQRVGLFLPYGPDNRAEFNHTQLIPQRMAMVRLRPTITGMAPKDLHTMWAASGVKEVVDEPEGEGVQSSARLLPEHTWP